MSKPYLITCQKCDKTFCSADPLQKFHVGCKPEKIIYKYNGEFRIIKLFVLDRDKYTCQLCGEHILNFRAHVHHINKNSLDDRLENLVSLCPSCHDKAHRENIESFELKEYSMDNRIEQVVDRKFFSKNRTKFYLDANNI